MGTGWQLVGVETRHLVETASRELEPSFEKFNEAMAFFDRTFERLERLSLDCRK